MRHPAGSKAIIMQLEGLTEPPTSKWTLIPPAWKSDVDGSLLRVMQKNRHLIEIHRQRAAELANLRPEWFSSELHDAWSHHNAFFDSLTGFLTPIAHCEQIGPEQARVIVSILRDMETVDTVTLCYSLAIKRHLESWQQLLGREVNPFKTFPASYLSDHQELLNNRLSLQKVLDKYHAASPTLMRQRLRKAPLHSIERCNATDMKEQLFHKTLYDGYVGKPPATKALVRTSTIDNYDEYLHLYSLAGMEGFFLKEFLDPKGEHQYRTATLQELVTKRERGKRLLRQVPLHRQPDDLTCSCSCASVAENLLYGARISDSADLQLYERVQSNELPGTCLAKLAEDLAARIPTAHISLIHSDPELFHNVQKYGAAGPLAVDEYRRALSKAKRGGVDLEIVPEDRTLERVRTVLEHGGVYLAATELFFGPLHTILYTGYLGDSYQIYDPLTGRSKIVSQEHARQRLRTSVGSWGLSITERDPRADSRYGTAMAWFNCQGRELEAGS